MGIGLGQARPVCPISIRLSGRYVPTGAFSHRTAPPLPRPNLYSMLLRAVRAILHMRSSTRDCNAVRDCRPYSPVQRCFNLLCCRHPVPLHHHLSLITDVSFEPCLHLHLSLLISPGFGFSFVELYRGAVVHGLLPCSVNVYPFLSFLSFIGRLFLPFFPL
jgi:hypothetical protein